MEQVFDPLRRKMVALTPEERVRQWFIGVLNSELGVPLTVMMSEVGMTFGQAFSGIDGQLRQKRFRADIVVYDQFARPLMLVECKRPEVDIDACVLEQAKRYDSVLEVRYIAATNGHRTLLLGRKDGHFRFLSGQITYNEMING